MNSTTGFPDRSIPFPQQTRRPCNTQLRRITPQVSEAFTRTAPGLIAGDTASAGGPSVLALAGPRSRMANGFGIPLLAGPGTALIPGVGRPITTADGCSTPVAEVGFTHRQSFTASIQARGFP